jgi:hypothetical protein
MIEVIPKIVFPFSGSSRKAGVAASRSGAAASLIFILSAIATLMVLGWCLELLAPVDPVSADPAVAAKFLYPSLLFPKPHDRFVFPIFVIVAFFSIVATALWRRTSIDPRVLFIVSSAGSILIAISIVGFKSFIGYALLHFLRRLARHWLPQLLLILRFPSDTQKPPN